MSVIAPPTGPQRDPRSARTRWRHAVRADQPAVLRIRLLASYTAEPLVPYLGLALLDAGLPPAIEVGPYNQVVQQCLAITAPTSGSEPGPAAFDVLLLAPRLDELGGAPGRAGWPAELARVASVALEAAGRARALLVFVLPEVPAERPAGVGDDGAAGGVLATAHAARETTRRLLAGRPGVVVVDVEEEVRAVGADAAFSPAMFRYAKVPYTEALFDGLGRRIGRALRLALGSRTRVVVLDADSLLTGERADEFASALRAPLQDLHEAGTVVALRGSVSGPGPCAASAGQVGEVLRQAEYWAVDGRPLAEQLAAVAAATGEPSAALAVLCARELEEPVDGVRVVRLGDDPSGWPGQLRAAGLFDRPEPSRGLGTHPSSGAEDREKPSGAGGSGTTPAGSDALAAFVAGLDVRLDFRTAPERGPDAVAELVARAKDFTLGMTPDAAALADRAGEILAVDVRDRYGDYGLGAVAALHVDGPVGVVDVFSVSCPVLGKAVEDAVLAELRRRAAASGCRELRIRVRDTGSNGVALRFLRAAVPAPDRDPAAADVVVTLDWAR